MSILPAPRPDSPMEFPCGAPPVVDHSTGTRPVLATSEASAASATSDAAALHWYALTVRHQHERQVERALASIGWETLVPTYRSQRRWSDRIREVELPLFGGYVLCRFALGDRIRVEDAPGVVRIVQFGGAPAALEPGEVASLRAAMASELPLSPWPYLKAGDRVRVERGPLRGVEGTLIRTRERRRDREAESLRLVIGLELLQRAVVVELAPDMILPLRAARREDP